MRARAGVQNQGFQTIASVVMAAGIASSTLPAEAQTFEIIAQRNQEAPQSGGATFSIIKPESVAISASGEVVFHSTLRGSGVRSSNNEGLYTSNGLAARKGDLPAGISDARISRFIGVPDVNASGEVSYTASLTGDRTRNVGVFTSSRQIARKGDLARGTNGADFLTFFAPKINASGDVAFMARLGGAGVSPSNDGVIFVGGRLKVGERRGDAPGLFGAPIGTLQGALGLSDSGDVSFIAVLASIGIGVRGDNNRAVFTNGNVVARKGNEVPGTDREGFRGVFSNTSISSADEVAFFDEVVTDDGFKDIIVGPQGVVARQDEVVPGVGLINETSRTPSINVHRQIAFTATVDRESVLFVADENGDHTVVLRRGDLLDLGNGVSRTVSTIKVGPSGLNDAGQIAAGVTFTDGHRAVVRITL
ncbi:MAG: choice-of-anchor tandem repeat NxxGxxAF-containing protein [Myxococcota bacterium]